MAFANPLEKLQEEAICSICLEYMSDPVSIDCGHNFCRACIATYCQGKGLGASGPVSCPQCRAAFHKSNVRPNKQLANIVETIKQLGLPPAKGQPEALCRKHEEKLKLFCEEDGEAICVVCRESLEHRPHTVYPIEEAAQVYKLLQRFMILIHAVDTSSSCSCVFVFPKEVVKKKRERIVTEFGKLHQLLAEEEKLLLQKLEQEEKIILQRINENLTKLLELRSSLDKLILEIKEKFQQSHDGLPLIRLSIHPSFLFLALPPEDVTLDPETAHPELVLSDDRKSVRRGGKKLILSLFDNPKRFNASPLVLGVQAFSTGRRYWEVQVGDKTEWGLGLCRESASRKGTVVLSPKNGYWVLRLQSGGKYEALTSPLTSLHLSVRPRRVGIFLDYKAGEITFYNVTDRDHIYTFTDQFSGPLRPLFFPGASAGGKNAEPLVISWPPDSHLLRGSRQGL
uniref:RING-type E3 ubiquitin transferase n=1 Tax=Chrysemys picta bellii TaxID=8478 RepID=A0A8C3FR74_CHRPI